MRRVPYWQSDTVELGRYEYGSNFPKMTTVAFKPTRPSLLIPPSRIDVSKLYTSPTKSGGSRVGLVETKFVAHGHKSRRGKAETVPKRMGRPDST
jgi:hypothetical protein